jgi:hypothetical protein
MSQINPFTGSILQSPQVQRQQAADKDRQVRRAQEAAKNTALSDDKLEHQVESSEELTGVHEDQQRRDRGSKRRGHKPDKSKSDDQGDKPHLDLTA